MRTIADTLADRSRRLRRFGRISGLCLIAAIVGAAPGTGAIAAGSNAQYPPTGPAGADFGVSTSDVFAHSQAPTGAVNEFPNSVPGGPPAGALTESSQFFGTLFGEAPAVGFEGLRKTQAGVISLSTGALGRADFDPDGSFLCTAVGFAPFPGTQAAGACIDPRAVETTSVTTYTPVVQFLELEVAGLGELALARFFAEIDGEELYSVEVAARDQLITDADLLITVSADLARLAVSTTLIESDLRSAFSVAPGIATLSNHTLFTSSLTLMAGESFAEGLQVGAAVTPEPSTAALAGLLLVAMVLTRGRARARRGASHDRTPPA